MPCAAPVTIATFPASLFATVPPLTPSPVTHDPSSTSHWLQRPVRRGRQLDPDHIARTHLAAVHHDTHHTRLAHEVALLVAVQCRRHQPWRDPVQLCAGIAQP